MALPLNPMTSESQRGSGAVLAIGIIAALAVASTATITTIDLLQLAGRAQRSADLAALAATDVAIGVVSAEPCDVARGIVTASGYTLAHCQVEDGTSDVTVTFEKGILPIEKKARAAPQRSPLWRDQ